MKDKQAVTRQRMSLPSPVTPEAALALRLEGLRILDAARHGHKLRTGHLRANRFVLTIRRLDVAVDEAVTRAAAILNALARPPGAPNLYGEQRFGRRNAESARRSSSGRTRKPKADRRRLFVSAYQSLLFNRWLEERIKDGLYRRVIAGDLLKKTDTGGLFVMRDPDADQARLDAGAIVPTGPMFGHSMRTPARAPSPPSARRASSPPTGSRARTSRGSRASPRSPA